MKIGVVGLGYVGLSTAATLATKFPTIGVDVSKTRVEELSEGKVPFHEKGLNGLLRKGISTGKLRFSSSAPDLGACDVIFITVGTPSGPDGSIDLSQVRKASTDIGGVIRTAAGMPVVMVRSTVIPGTSRNVIGKLVAESSGKKAGTGFGLCSNPEFLREGSAIQDALRPQRIVLGPIDGGSLAMARSMYKTFYGKKTPQLVVTTPEGAELIKYGSNSFLASKVSFINLLSNVCELFPGTDVNDVALGMGLDSRIGKQFLQAGPGFGGSCFGKDLHAFSKYLHGIALDASILESVLRINDFQPKHVIALAESKAGSLDGKIVAVLGLAFKAETSDTRDSRSIPVIRGLVERGALVRVYDPAASWQEQGIPLTGVTQATSLGACVAGADLAITLTAWKEFQRLKPNDFARLMRSPVLIDARRIYDPVRYGEKVTYCALGRGADIA